MTESLVSIALGAFRFGVLQSVYDRLRHTMQERWEVVDRAGAHPSLQWAGHGTVTLMISGVVYPHHLGTLRLVQLMRIEARRAQPLLLIDGLGFYWGRWVIDQVAETSSHHMADGAPRAQAFQLRLTRYPGDERGLTP